MGERIKQYRKYIDDMLANPDENIDWEDELKRHLLQISFFAHERLIHLIVLVLFALMTIMVFLYTINHVTLGLILLFVALMVLLIPYIKHYFLMENSVQWMYEQYDKMLELSGKKAFKREGEIKL